jgi:hypothetical protein
MFSTITESAPLGDAISFRRRQAGTQSEQFEASVVMLAERPAMPLCRLLRPGAHPEEATMPHLSFPNESAEYRTARNALLDCSKRSPLSAARCRPAARRRRTSRSSASMQTSGRRK